MYDIIAQLCLKLTLQERQNLLVHLERLIDEELAAKKQSVSSCPHCGSTYFVKKGHNRAGEQRWICKSCNHTFSKETKGLLSYSKLDAYTWHEYAKCMIDHLPLRECAKRCKVSLPTSWFMRMRICEVMKHNLMAFRVEVARPTEIDGMYLNESLCGNWNRSNSFSMPRPSHINGCGVKARGISNEKICVVCGVNDLGDCFCELTSRGRATAADLYDVLKGKVGNASIVLTDKHRSYIKAFEKLNVAVHKAIDSKDGSGDTINMVNSLHARLREFLLPFHSVSTRRLQNYLDWFCYMEQFRKSDADKRETLFKDATNGHYQTTRRQYSLDVIPFREYWDNMKMSTVV